ncbi:M15 family metallopeptidase [Reichenbachiella ulvae]|uniref:D-alanyl-D-alanine dipeptidase n=1 Tax=Reichenbachiella ulvae TaxID=2980104 RepID=A0ABT3CQC8_9BACT|nr:M15 family metallopeptidase [Reichenbachiella ulvae]MCV9385844.1 M15 family metallopeptidase [Reichenbachiella ulvae]
MNQIRNLTLLLLLSISACQPAEKQQTSTDQIEVESIQVAPDEPRFEALDISNWSDSSFVDLSLLSNSFVYDMKYAGLDNFLKEKVYPCAHCLLRKPVALALIEANDSLAQHNMQILIFDCYRPLSVQKKMWEIYPKPSYVANPKYGSVHNRGGAVDIGLVSDAGEIVDMGTGFDHFGPEAHHSYSDLPIQVKDNRALLRSIMMHFGFNPIRTEWWHYNYQDNKKFEVSDFPLDCN